MVKEKLAAIGKPLRKFASTPNLAAAVIYMYFFNLRLCFFIHQAHYSDSRGNFLFVSSLLVQC